MRNFLLGLCRRFELHWWREVGIEPTSSTYGADELPLLYSALFNVFNGADADRTHTTHCGLGRLAIC